MELQERMVGKAMGRERAEGMDAEEDEGHRDERRELRGGEKRNAGHRIERYIYIYMFIYT